MSVRQPGSPPLAANKYAASVAAANSTLTISPTTGAVLAQINLATANTWSGAITLSTNTKVQFRDTTMYLQSSGSAVLDLVGGGTINIGATSHTTSNIATGATTSNFGQAGDVKVGSSGNKVGFYGGAGIVKPTTAYGAATFVTNTSLIANDTATWDGYTIGQIVKALRDRGDLA